MFIILWSELCDRIAAFTLTGAHQLAPPSISLFTKLKLIYLTRKMECSTLHQNCLASDLPTRRQCSQKKEIFQRNVWAIFGNDWNTNCFFSLYCCHQSKLQTTNKGEIAQNYEEKEFSHWDTNKHLHCVWFYCIS